MNYPTEKQVKETVNAEFLNMAIDCYIELRPNLTRLDVLREMKSKGSVYRTVTKLAVMALATY